jgi:N-carbamoyl-L-amino-acid hydrolase
MRLRKDALFAATHLMQHVIDIALAHQPDGRGTVGCVEVFPNSRNVIPGRVAFTVDFRHATDAGLRAMDQALRDGARELAQRFPVGVTVEQVVYFEPVAFAPALVDAVRQGAARAGCSHLDIVSGAGHDAVYVARTAPAAMIFVPCKDGISHNEIEDAAPADLAAGANVLLHAMLARAIQNVD